MDRKQRRFAGVVMRISTLIFIVICGIGNFTYAEKSHAQTLSAYRLELTVGNESLHDVLVRIQEKTKLSFAYDQQALQSVTLPARRYRNLTLDVLLDRLLTETGYGYETMNRNVVIAKRAAERKQQPGKIIGQITDLHTGEPMSGVTVEVSSLAKVVQTNATGAYELTVDAGTYSILARFVGYQPVFQDSVMVEVGQRITLNIVMEPVASELEEVVVVGYGTQKKANVIGSVSQVSAENLDSRPITRLAQGLTGQMSGVTVIQRSGKPGPDSDGAINIRGIGSFGAEANPLILIDGIPGSLGEVNPADIESVSVLKDASSAAIYGARSANGVILVTTKSAGEGRFRVDYTGYAGIQHPTELPDFANSWEYAEMYNIASGTNSYTVEEIAKYRSGTDPDNYPNTHFLRETLSRNGVQTGHNLTIANGQKATQYFLSAGYLGQQGLVEENYYNRYNFRLNTVSNLGDAFSLTTRVFGSFEQRNEPIPTGTVNDGNLEGMIWRAIREPSNVLGQASNGDFGIGHNGLGTPVSWLASDSYRRNPTTKAGVNMRLAWNPIPDLRLSAIGGYNYAVNELRSYQASQILSADFAIPESKLNQEKNSDVFMTMQYLAEYTKQLHQNNIEVLAGYSFEKQVYEDFRGYRQGFPSNDYTVIDMGGVDVQTVNGNDYGWAIQSVFGRARYDYAGKYLFEGTLRYDGSSRFPKNNKYALFPSMAAGWRISEEQFFQAQFPWVSNMKLKGSWGILGNQNIGNYPYQSTLVSGFNYPFGSGLSNGAAYTQYRDPGVHWESTRTTDLGIETGFLNEKIRFNATYFNRNTYDILYQPSSSVSSVLGVAISETNTGKVRNSGWEFELTHQNKFNEFSYQIQGNLSIINNEVTTLGIGNVNLPNGMVGNGSNLFIGYPMEMYYGYRSDGVFLDEPDIANWADQRRVTPNPVPGDIRYVDISGPDGVPDGTIDPTYDRTYLGSRIPKYTFSLTLGAQYKGVDFSALLQGVSGVNGQLSAVAGHAFFGDVSNIQRWQMEERFDPTNPQRYPGYPRLEQIGNNGSPNTTLSDFWVLNASYLRIKNIQLGYTLPKAVLNSIHASRLRIYFSADNLHTFKGYRQGWDPEINTTGMYYPILGVMTFGINASF